MPGEFNIKKFLAEWEAQSASTDPELDIDTATVSPELIKIQCKESKKTVTVPSDMMCRPQTTRFEEDLAIYGDAEDIIRVHRDRPDLLKTKRKDPKCDGDCENCDKSSGSSCSS